MTPVIFKYDSNEDEVIAIFFTQKYNEKLYGDNLLNGYTHLEQHSSIHKDFLKELPNATSQQYQPLLDELKNQIGYRNLLVVNGKHYFNSVVPSEMSTEERAFMYLLLDEAMENGATEIQIALPSGYYNQPVSRILDYQN